MDNLSTGRESQASKKQPLVTIDSVGPPKILQYKAETKINEVAFSPLSSSSVSLQSEPVEDIGQLMKDFNVYIDGGHVCEFCGETTKPWPSLKSHEEILDVKEVKLKLKYLYFLFKVIVLNFG